MSNNNINGLNSINELSEAQKQISLLQERLKETNGNFKILSPKFHQHFF
jgi:hypothetical protein